MKLTIKRIVPICLIVALSLLLITACGRGNGGDETAATPTPAADTGNQDQQEVTPGDDDPFAEHVTLTMWHTVGGASGVQTDPVAQYLHDMFNITIDWDLSASDERFMAMLAAGDLPDIIFRPLTDADVLVQGGHVIPLDGLVADLAPDITTYYQPTLEFMRNNFPPDNDGTLWGLPAHVFHAPSMPDRPWSGWYVRWDFFKALGYPLLQHPNEIMDLAEQMLEFQPINEAGIPFMAFSPMAEWGMQFMVANTFAEFYGLHQIGHVYWDIETFEPMNLFTDPASPMWVGADFWQQANNRGLVDPDWLIQSYATMEAKHNTNQVLISNIGWVGNWFATAELLAMGYEEAGYTGPIPVYGSRGFRIGGANVGGGGWGYFITTNNQHPERSMELINFFYSAHGVATLVTGTQWTGEYENWRWTDEGEKYMTDRFIDIVTNRLDVGMTWAEWNGNLKYINAAGTANSSMLPGRNFPSQGSDSPINNRRVVTWPEGDVFERFGGANLVEALVPPGSRIVQNVTFDTAVALPPVHDWDPAIQELYSVLYDLLELRLADAVLARSQAEFEQIRDAAIAEFIALGSDDFFEYVVNLVNETRARIES
ncbi:MAG: hypothetical protein FWC73_04570 [Defluviitaleaceae bacterium]|nr:hypothetical protein [Defluviitaleaceae bacterium]